MSKLLQSNQSTYRPINPRYDNRQADQLGYRPQDSADDYAADILGNPMPPKEPSGDNPVAQFYQGGHFCTLDFTNPETLFRIVENQTH